MNSTDPNVLPTSSPVLEHTRNTEGELGSFVNPYACDCRTCHEVVEERRIKKAEKELVPNLPPGPPLRRVNAFADVLGRSRIMPSGQEEFLEADAMSKLLSLRRQLLKRREGASEAKRQRTEQRIMAIESILETFGVELS
jgi:hypothetical protein